MNFETWETSNCACGWKEVIFVYLRHLSTDYKYMDAKRLMHELNFVLSKVDYVIREKNRQVLTSIMLDPIKYCYNLTLLLWHRTCVNDTGKIDILDERGLCCIGIIGDRPLGAGGLQPPLTRKLTCLPGTRN